MSFSKSSKSSESAGDTDCESKESNDFLTDKSLHLIQKEALNLKKRAFYCSQKHTILLTKNSKFNRVIVSYINPDRNYQVDETQFPPIDDSALPSSDQHATMKTADGGFLLEGRFDFKTITSPYQAEEMAEIVLRRSRESLGLTIITGFNSYQLHIGDIVNITHASLGFSAKAFRVNSISFNEDFTVGLNLIEHQNSHYTFASKNQVSSTPSTTLPKC